jgi:branched-chain amino acid transport system permease protein
MRRAVVELGAPVLLVVATVLITGAFSRAHQLEFKNALVMTAIAVALYVFIGNSGVISFGHVSFVAVGIYLGGILTVDPETKTFTMPGLFPFLRHTHISVVASLAFAALAGGLYGLAVGLPLMRLSGLPAGIATFAVLGITADVLYYWQKVGPTAQTLSDIPEAGRWTLGVATIIAIAAAYAAGISIYRQRLIAFSLSGALAGLAGGLYVHQLGLIAPDLTYLDLTFVTLAMLVFGGVASLWGAVLGALAISALNSFLGDAENTVHVGFRLTLPAGTRLVTIGAVMALVIILRPSGLTGGREFGWRRR